MLALMSAGGGVGAGAGVEFLLQASATVMTQPASTASAASSVKSRLVMVIVGLDCGTRSDIRCLHARSRARGRTEQDRYLSFIHAHKGCFVGCRRRRVT